MSMQHPNDPFDSQNSPPPTTATLSRLVADPFMWTGEQQAYVAGFILAIAIVLLTAIWSRRRRTASTLKRNNNSFIQIAKSSSAAGLASLKQVSSSASFARLSEAVKSLKCFKNGCFVHAISAAELFVSPAVVKKMSLQELTSTIEYAVKINQSDFDSVSFIAGLSLHVKEIIAAMDTAVIRSRGVNVQMSSSSMTHDGNGDYDALYFCAAMRLYVEWRAVRINPVKYKSYAVGMNVAKRDLIQNTTKVESAIHAWIEHQVVSGSGEELEVFSPTVRQLLDFEHVNNVHTRLPKLKDKTAAIGLLWMNRQLQFQTQIFKNLQKVPTTYRTAIDAVRAAYKSVFDRYHGWTIQQVFNYSFNGAPPVSVVFRLMNPEVETESDDDAPGGEDMVMVDYPPPETVESSFVSSLGDDCDDDDDLDTCESCDGFNLIKIGQDIQRNWDKLAANVERDWSNFVDNLPMNKEKRHRAASANNKKAGDQRQALRRMSTTDSEPSNDVQIDLMAPRRQRSAAVPKFVLNRDALQQNIEKEATRAAHKDIAVYLNIMDPLLKDLTRTIDGFGMNDPSRV